MSPKVSHQVIMKLNVYVTVTHIMEGISVHTYCMAKNNIIHVANLCSGHMHNIMIL